MKSIEKRHELFIKEFLEKGHEFTLDEDGENDYFAYSNSKHNGPECKKCNESWCWHCWESGDQEIFLCTK